MRASELLGLMEARLQYQASTDGKRLVPRIDGKPVSLRLLHNMRVQRDLRNAEIAAHHEFVKLMYGPRPSEEKRSRRRTASGAARPPNRSRKPGGSAPNQGIT